jgi:hypothetical protein
MSISLLTQQLMDIVQLFLHMDKQVLEKLIQWQANRKYFRDKFISQMIEKALFLVRFNNFGKK